MNIQIITDSTADIPDELIENLSIRVVPIYLRFGEKTYQDGVTISKNEFYEMLPDAPVHPATSGTHLPHAGFSGVFPCALLELHPVSSRPQIRTLTI